MKRPRRRTAPLVLPAILDLSAAATLAGTLRQRAAAPVTLDGAAVERLGGQCLQVLLSAQATWARAGLGFQITAPSAALTEALAAFGAASLVASKAGETGA